MEIKNYPAFKDKLDWSKITNKTAVHCKTKEECDALLTECEKHEIKWNSGASPKSSSSFKFSEYGDSTCLVPFYTSIGMAYSNCEFWKENDYTVIEFSDLCKPDLPRICYILGGEDNPLKIGETFKIDGLENTYKIKADGHIYNCRLDGGMAAQHYLENIINGDCKIIRSPQFSEDEKALMRLYVGKGYSIFKPNAFDPHVTAWDKSESHGYEFPDGILLQITSPFDAKAYLEGLK